VFDEVASPISTVLLPILTGILALSALGTFWVLGDMGGVTYLALFLLTSVPGLPLGFALFGRRHMAAWIVGLPLGYAFTTLACWAAIFLGYSTTAVLTSAWVCAFAAVWLGARRLSSPLIALPPWTRRDTLALCLLLLLVPVLVTRPFSKLGSKDAEGNRLYRAYFSADFVWHTALAAELAKHEPRPVNPFLASEPVHYYWTYFRIPSTIAARTGLDVQAALKLNATATAFLFLAAIYLAAWAAFPGWPMATAAAVAVTFLAPSAEGLAAIVDLLRRGHSLNELRDLNIDAVASWAFKGVRIDNLPRAMWYNPQHSFSCALGLCAIPIVLWGGLRAKPAAIVLTGTLLGASVTFNPLLGAAFCGIYGVTILAALITDGGGVRDIGRHLLAVVPVACALAWCTLNQVGDGALEALRFGFSGAARNATVLNLLLQLGPILLLTAIGLWPALRLPYAPVWPAAAGIAIGLALMHLVVLTVNPAWVPFRGGQIFLVMAPAIVTRAFAGLWMSGRRTWALSAAAVVLVSGLPTTAVDAYNTQDVTNPGLSPGAAYQDRVDAATLEMLAARAFRWTITVTPDEQEALRWIRTNTAPDAIVQAEPAIRGRDTWSFIQTFAERRSATGYALPLLPARVYDERNARVRTIYASDDATLAWQEAKALGIDYLYADAVERAAYPGVAKFGAHPELFQTAFRNAEAAVYAVRR
jgi:hypothetical protein